MKQPTIESINDWIEDSYESLARKDRLAQEGFREKHNLPLEGLYRTKGEYYQDIAICQALLGDKDKAREALYLSVEYGIVPYRMAYDEHCDLRHQTAKPGQNHYMSLPETTAQLYAMAALDDEGFNKDNLRFVRLMESIENDTESLEMVQTVRALCFMMDEDKDAAAEAVLKIALDHSQVHPVKGGWRARTYVINLGLWGIVRKEQNTFDEALGLLLKNYEKESKGEMRDMPGAYVCLIAVGLIKLARRYGLTYEDKHPLIPSALL
ncbi:immunity 49 family protein [Photobacterium sp. TLY01]|uniref:immunity 49 family protein n=1 Tax=Photobacterium sp. TLY01 TaxID=2907534 RepID=UPI001F2CDFE7|nr:immunity 49 family protein [Photobacterium sp. TLY01]UIP30622.1 immunity 49 family protein [Photobacterium sp. TLY01]